MERFYSNIKGALKKFVFVSVVSLFFCSSLFVLSSCNYQKLKLDLQNGEFAASVVNSAQYAPAVEKIGSSNSSLQSGNLLNGEFLNIGNDQTNAERDDELAEEFNAIVAAYSRIVNYAGAGKYLGYDIYEIKDEINFVTSHVPAFNQWFRMPTMREEEGYVAIPYYEGWAYYLELTDNVLTITRVCWATRSCYYDEKTNTTIERHSDGSSFIQFEVMRTNYYFDEDNVEVVESYFYSVGIDNVKSNTKFNSNEKDYYPFEYQYLKNVKDKYLIKYHITAAERLDGMDISGQTPYGHLREFTVLDYEGYRDIKKTEIIERLPNAFNKSLEHTIDGLSLEDENLNLINDSIGLTGSFSVKSVYLDAVAKQIIDNFAIKEEFSQIYGQSSQAVTAEKIYGDFYKKTLPISGLHCMVDFHGSSSGYFHASADIYDKSLFDKHLQYSLSLALKSSDGKLFLLSRQFEYPEEVEYNGGNGRTYLRLSGTSANIAFDNLYIDDEGEYIFTTALEKKVGDGHEIMFDTLQTVYAVRCNYIKPYRLTTNKGTFSIAVMGTGGALRVTVQKIA